MNENDPPLALTPSQLDCLASPARAEIVRTLAMNGTASARELAQWLGRSVTRLYHHLGVLADAGLIEVIGSRPRRRRAETVYALVASRLSSAEAIEQEGGREALAKASRRFLAAAARKFARALASPETIAAGPQRQLSLRQIQTRLSPDLIAALNAELDALTGKYASEADCEGTPLTLTIVVTPGR